MALRHGSRMCGYAREEEGALAETKTVDQRFIKTHYLIKATFKDMVRTMDANKINISDIAAQAGINRKTFYVHYECREDLFNEVCDEIVHRYGTEMGKNCADRFGESGAFYRTFFEFFSRQDPYVERMLCHPSYYPYRERIIKGCANDNRHRLNIFLRLTEEEQALFEDFAANNMFNLYRRWVELGKNIPLDHLIDFSYKMVYRGMSWIIVGVEPPRTEVGEREQS